MEELAEKRLSGNTLIWFEGLSGWKSAQDVSEVKDAFIPTPPPSPGSGQVVLNQSGQKEDQHKDLLLIFVLGFMLVGGVLTYVFQRVFHEWFRPPLYFIQVGFNFLFAVTPVLFSLTIRDKNLKVIGLVISILLALFNIGTNIFYMITFLNR